MFLWYSDLDVVWILPKYHDALGFNSTAEPYNAPVLATVQEGTLMKLKRMLYL